MTPAMQSPRTLAMAKVVLVTGGSGLQVSASECRHVNSIFVGCRWKHVPQ